MEDYISNYQTSNEFSASSVYGDFTYENSADRISEEWDFAGWRN